MNSYSMVCSAEIADDCVATLTSGENEGLISQLQVLVNNCQFVRFTSKLSGSCS